MIIQQQLKDLVTYDPKTGIMIWKFITSNRVKKDRKMGHYANGYLMTSIFGKKYQVHRLAWLYVYGEFPKHMLDHINRIRDDNRIENLREVTVKQNNENISLRSHNTSGHRGVGWHKGAKKWMAYITHNKKQIHLGLFDDLNKAVEVAKNKRAELFTHA